MRKRRNPPPDLNAGATARPLRSDPNLYRVVYGEAQRAVDDQTDELNGIRSRSGTYMSFVGSATAFLVGSSFLGSGLNGVQRDWLFYTLAGIASGLSIFALSRLWRVLRPVRAWEFRLSAEVLIAQWIESDLPVPNEAALYQALALRYDKMRLANERSLDRIRRAYAYLMMSGGMSILCWAAIIWARA